MGGGGRLHLSLLGVRLRRGLTCVCRRRLARFHVTVAAVVKRKTSRFEFWPEFARACSRMAGAAAIWAWGPMVSEDCYFGSIARVFLVMQVCISCLILVECTQGFSFSVWNCRHGGAWLSAFKALHGGRGLHLRVFRQAGNARHARCGGERGVKVVLISQPPLQVGCSERGRRPCFFQPR